MEEHSHVGRQDYVFGRKHNGGALALGGRYLPNIDYGCHKESGTKPIHGRPYSDGSHAMPDLLVVTGSCKSGSQIWVVRLHHSSHKMLPLEEQAIEKDGMEVGGVRTQIPKFMYFPSLVSINLSR